MKKVLLLLLLSPIGLFSQSRVFSDSSSFCRIDFVDIGKLEGNVDGNPRSYTIIRTENITDMRTNKVTNAVAIFIDPRFITIEGSDVDSLIAALSKMVLVMQTVPPNTLEMAYKCRNGFEFQIDFTDRKWYVSFSEYTSVHHYSQVSIEVKEVPELITLLKQAKTAFK
jgi:hypothetical protein